MSRFNQYKDLIKTGAAVSLAVAAIPATAQAREMHTSCNIPQTTEYSGGAQVKLPTPQQQSIGRLATIEAKVARSKNESSTANTMTITRRLSGREMGQIVVGCSNSGKLDFEAIWIGHHLPNGNENNVPEEQFIFQGNTAGNNFSTEASLGSQTFAQNHETTLVEAGHNKKDPAAARSMFEAQSREALMAATAILEGRNFVPPSSTLS